MNAEQLPNLSGLALSRNDQITTKVWPWETYKTNTMDNVADDVGKLPNRDPIAFKKVVEWIISQPDAMKVMEELMAFCRYSETHECLPQDWEYAMIQWLGTNQYNALNEIAEKYIVSRTNIVARVFGNKPAVDDYNDRNWSRDPWNGKDNFDIFREAINHIDTSFYQSARTQHIYAFFELPYCVSLFIFKPREAFYGPVLFISKLETVLAYYIRRAYKWAVRREYCIRNFNHILTEREGDKVRRKFSFPEEEEFELEQSWNQKRIDPDNPQNEKDYDAFPKVDRVALTLINLSIYAEKHEFGKSMWTFYGRFFTPWGLAVEAPMNAVRAFLSRG